MNGECSLFVLVVMTILDIFLAMEAITKLHKELSKVNTDVERCVTECDEQVREIKMLKLAVQNATDAQKENLQVLNTLAESRQQHRSELDAIRFHTHSLEVSNSCVEAQLSTIPKVIVEGTMRHIAESTKIVEDIADLSRRASAEADIRCAIASTVQTSASWVVTLRALQVKAAKEAMIEKQRLRQQLDSEEESLSLVLVSIDAFDSKIAEMEESLSQLQGSQHRMRDPPPPPRQQRCEDSSDNNSASPVTNHSRPNAWKRCVQAGNIREDMDRSQATAVSMQTVTTTTTVNTTVLPLGYPSESHDEVLPAMSASVDGTPWYRQLKRRRGANSDNPYFHSSGESSSLSRAHSLVDENLFYDNTNN
jgi:hypothetical protein